MHAMSESITIFSERNTQKFREAAIKVLLCNLTMITSLTMIFLYICRFELDRYLLIPILLPQFQ